jgi:TonB family protein
MEDENVESSDLEAATLNMIEQDDKRYVYESKQKKEKVVTLLDPQTIVAVDQIQADSVLFVQELPTDIPIVPGTTGTGQGSGLPLALPEPLPIEEPKEDPIVLIPEVAPVFLGDQSAEKDAANSDRRLQLFIKKHIKYPTLAKEIGQQGMAVIRFVVEPNGKVSQMSILRDPGAGLGDEALRIVQLMNQSEQPWLPGIQRDRRVRVYFTLPVRFTLQ